jgi:hypothetical protein
MMTLPKSIYLILLALFFIGCKSDSAKHDFYSYTKSFDLWRLPLSEPFELISPTNSGDWFLVIKNPGFKNPDFYTYGDEFQLPNIESVGILDSVIVIHSTGIYWPKLSGSYNTTLIIDTKTQSKLIYSNQHHRSELNDKLGELNIKSIKLYPLESVLKSFQANLSLPKEWH